MLLFNQHLLTGICFQKDAVWCPIQVGPHEHSPMSAHSMNDLYHFHKGPPDDDEEFSKLWCCQLWNHSIWDFLCIVLIQIRLHIETELAIRVPWLLGKVQSWWLLQHLWASGTCSHPTPSLCSLQMHSQEHSMMTQSVVLLPCRSEIWACTCFETGSSLLDETSSCHQLRQLN